MSPRSKAFVPLMIWLTKQLSSRDKEIIPTRLGRLIRTHRTEDHHEDQGGTDGGVEGADAVDDCVRAGQLLQHAGIGRHHLLHLRGLQGAQVQHAADGGGQGLPQPVLVHLGRPGELAGKPWTCMHLREEGEYYEDRGADNFLYSKVDSEWSTAHQKCITPTAIQFGEEQVKGCSILFDSPLSPISTLILTGIIPAPPPKV